jgi:hypothetical protein
VRAVSDGALKRATLAKPAPDLANRFGIAEERVVDIDCVCDISLVRDTEHYRIKPHPNGLNKIVTMQFDLPESESQLDLATSLFVRHRGLFGGSFEEVKQFPFKPYSAYGVRNSLLVLFQRVSPRDYGQD